MKFKIYIYLLFGIFLGTHTAIAQNDRKDAIEAQKVAFITKAINLTPKEAETFWPLYNEYQQKRDNLKMEERKLRKTVKENYDDMSDKELENFVDQELDYKQKELDLAKEFHKKMKAVLPMKKVALYYKAVEDFNKVLVGMVKGPKGQ
jgi:hypothetical protein